MTSLVNDAKEKIEVTRKSINVIENTIAVLIGEKQEDPEKNEPKANCVQNDLDLLARLMQRLLKDVELLDAIVCGTKPNCGSGEY